MTHTITPAVRFSAIALERGFEVGGAPLLASVIRDARYVDGFPHSYTEAAQALADDVLAAAADNDLERLEFAVFEIDALRSAGRWYA